ncbi:TPR2-like protein isoform X1 [Tanacetum coccineum]
MPVYLFKEDLDHGVLLVGYGSAGYAPNRLKEKPMKIFFELRKQNYLEAFDRQVYNPYFHGTSLGVFTVILKNDRAKDVEILVKDFKIFLTFNKLFKEITQLLTLDIFRQNEKLSKYEDTKSARSIMLVELKNIIEANPLFRENLTLPVFEASRLRTLINQRS